MDPPWPLLSVEVTCRRTPDALRFHDALAKLAEADSLLEFARGEAPGEVTISGRDERHLVSTLLHLTREQGFDLAVGEARVARREALGHGATIDHTHSAMAPPRFARVRIAFTRATAWSGVQVFFAARAELPERFLPDIRRGVEKAAGAGLVAGCPVIDVAATVEGGAWHEQDSTPEAFEAAAVGAFGQLRMLGQPYVIEPIMETVVETPAHHCDAIALELKARKGAVSSRPMNDGQWRVVAKAPLSQLLGFADYLQRRAPGAKLAVLYDGYGHVVAPTPDPDGFAPAAAKRA